ncbi:MAG TPA: helix-turn-helix domain-containing protein [Polyangiaceae bacterium]|nr:helix-turn-helix domain-containing protein [Polyangiaceae bacterium]
MVAARFRAAARPETADAVIQAEIAARLELDRATICEVLQRLEARALVSRGGDMTSKGWRILLTEKAEGLLLELDAQIEAASTTAH